MQHKYRNNAPDGLFRRGSSYTPVIQDMRSEAIKDWECYMPGKDISKRITNFNVLAILNDFTPTDYPDELRAYVTDMNTFFNGGGND